MPSTICGARPCLGLHVDRVLEGAAHHVGAAADHRAQRLRAAGEVDDGRLQPLVLEVAALLGDGQRQVVQQVLAADGDRQLGLLGRLRARGRRKTEGGGGAGEQESASLHEGPRCEDQAAGL
jgi:hypothetical protein